MSDILNSVNGVGLDTTFPLSGQNNSTEGFRKNSRAVLAGLTQANTEVGAIQSTHLVFTGDLTGTSAALGTATSVNNGDPALNVSVVLGDVLIGGATIDLSSHLYSLGVDSKGRIISYNAVDPTIAWGSGHAAGTNISPVGSSLGTGTGQIVFPTFTFNTLGRLVATGNQIVTYGLLGHTLARGTVIAGGSNNQSQQVTPPTVGGTYNLVSDGTTVSWQAVAATGTLTGVTAGQGIKATSSGTTVAVAIDFSNASSSTNIADTDLFSWQNATLGTLNSIPFSALANKIAKLSRDTAPLLTAPMTTAGFALQSLATNAKASITIAEAGITLQTTSNTPISLNGTLWPSTIGTQGQYLSLATNGQLVWTSLNQFYQIIPNTIFVGTSGDDTDGNGSLNSPYLTINKAVGMIPTNSPNLYTIMLLGGTYTENLVLHDIQNLAIEGFFSSSPAIIKGHLLLNDGIQYIYGSKLIFDTSNEDATINSPTFNSNASLLGGTFSYCSFIRGANALSDLPVINFTGNLMGDINFQNCTIAGTVQNQTISNNGARLILTNLGLPTNGWTGLTVNPGSSTYVNNAPLMSGIRHDGGILSLENISSIKPSTYSISVANPSLPLWVNGKPKFLATDGTQVFADDGVAMITLGSPTLLLDANGNSIPSSDGSGNFQMTLNVQVLVPQDDTVTTYVVGLYSGTNSDTGQSNATSTAPFTNRLELNNVVFSYNADFTTVYKFGTCEWSFNRVKRRSDLDIITGPRISYDVQPDEGQFIAHYYANGSHLNNVDDSSPVTNGMVDSQSGKTFQVELRGNSTITLKTPLVSSYSPGPLPTSGEMYGEILIAVVQDSTGTRSLSFVDDQGVGITWLTNNSPNLLSGQYTFYLFRYFSKTRRWIGQKFADGDYLGINTSSDNLYYLGIGDAGKYIRRNSSQPNQVVIPNNNMVPLPVGSQIQIVQAGTGQTQILGQSQVTIYSPYGLWINGQMGRVTLTKIGQNTWDVGGDLKTTIAAPRIITIDSTQITIDSTSVLLSRQYNTIDSTVITIDSTTTLIA